MICRSFYFTYFKVIKHKRVMPVVSVLGSNSRNQLGLASAKWGFFGRKGAEQIEENWRLGGRLRQGRALPQLLPMAGGCGCGHYCWKGCQHVKSDRCPVQVFRLLACYSYGDEIAFSILVTAIILECIFYHCCTGLTFLFCFVLAG